VTGHAQFADDKNVERRIECFGDLEGDWYTVCPRRTPFATSLIR
jgi:hypothetical protein